MENTSAAGSNVVDPTSCLSQNNNADRQQLKVSQGQDNFALGAAISTSSLTRSSPTTNQDAVPTQTSSKTTWADDVTDTSEAASGTSAAAEETPTSAKRHTGFPFQRRGSRKKTLSLNPEEREALENLIEEVIMGGVGEGVIDSDASSSDDEDGGVFSTGSRKTDGTASVTVAGDGLQKGSSSLKGGKKFYPGQLKVALKHMHDLPPRFVRKLAKAQVYLDATGGSYPVYVKPSNTVDRIEEEEEMNFHGQKDTAAALIAASAAAAGSQLERDKDRAKLKENKLKETKKKIRTMLSDRDQYVDEKSASSDAAVIQAKPSDELQNSGNAEGPLLNPVLPQQGAISCGDLEREMLSGSSSATSHQSGGYLQRASDVSMVNPSLSHVDTLSVEVQEFMPKGNSQHHVSPAVPASVMQRFSPAVPPPCSTIYQQPQPQQIVQTLPIQLPNAVGIPETQYWIPSPSLPATGYYGSSPPVVGGLTSVAFQSPYSYSVPQQYTVQAGYPSVYSSPYTYQSVQPPPQSMVAASPYSMSAAFNNQVSYQPQVPPPPAPTQYGGATSSIGQTSHYAAVNPYATETSAFVQSGLGTVPQQQQQLVHRIISAANSAQRPSSVPDQLLNASLQLKPPITMSSVGRVSPLAQFQVAAGPEHQTAQNSVGNMMASLQLRPYTSVGNYQATTTMNSGPTGRPADASVTGHVPSQMQNNPRNTHPRNFQSGNVAPVSSAHQMQSTPVPFNGGINATMSMQNANKSYGTQMNGRYTRNPVHGGPYFGQQPRPHASNRHGGLRQPGPSAGQNYQYTTSQNRNMAGNFMHNSGNVRPLLEGNPPPGMGHHSTPKPLSVSQVLPDVLASTLPKENFVPNVQVSANEATRTLRPANTMMSGLTKSGGSTVAPAMENEDVPSSSQSSGQQFGSSTVVDSTSGLANSAEVSEAAGKVENGNVNVSAKAGISDKCRCTKDVHYGCCSECKPDTVTETETNASVTQPAINAGSDNSEHVKDTSSGNGAESKKPARPSLSPVPQVSDVHNKDSAVITGTNCTVEHLPDEHVPATGDESKNSVKCLPAAVSLPVTTDICLSSENGVTMLPDSGLVVTLSGSFAKCLEEMFGRSTDLEHVTDLDVSRPVCLSREVAQSIYSCFSRSLTAAERTSSVEDSDQTGT